MKFPYRGQEYYINDQLANVLNSYVYNIKKDWDFVLVITGDRTVRIGKSTLAFTVCAYLDYLMKELKINDDYVYSGEHIFWDSKQMVEKLITEKKMYRINHYDE